MSGFSVKIEGYPEKVQRIADAIDGAFPDMVTWVQSFDRTDDVSIIIEGFESLPTSIWAIKPEAA